MTLSMGGVKVIPPGKEVPSPLPPLGLSHDGSAGRTASLTTCKLDFISTEEEGLHGVHRQLRRNEHPKTKEGISTRKKEEGLHGVHRQLRRNEHPKTKEGC
jgi:hypothetical protein